MAPAVGRQQGREAARPRLGARLRKQQAVINKRENGCMAGMMRLVVTHDGPLIFAGASDEEVPDADNLAKAGVKSFESEGDGGKGADSLLAKLNSSLEDTDIQLPTPLVTMGTGLPALPKKLVAKILANEYIDFAELPPARGKTRPASQALEGQVIVVQAADLLQTRKIIPDLATWLQCFSLYVATIATKFPGRVPELMAYQMIIAKASQRYRWPSWIVYDQNFRQEAAGSSKQAWGRVDPSIYAQCFTGQALSNENWCSRCQCLDHTSMNCPYRPRRKWSTTPGVSPGGTPSKQDHLICIKYNRFNGDCKFGKECRFLHLCSSCKEPHPVSRCKANKESVMPNNGPSA